ncbi:MAG TPA: hypothetical protein VFN52_05445, partial [Acidiferrobacteraceae bacterium]|nr:hypothetical protein [Acidiferrobacteraceae bacterium]
MSVLEFGLSRTAVSLALALGTLLTPVVAQADRSSAARSAPSGAQPGDALHSVFMELRHARWIAE